MEVEASPGSHCYLNKYQPMKSSSVLTTLCGMRDLYSPTIQGRNPRPLQWQCGTLTAGPREVPIRSVIFTVILRISQLP